MICFFMVLINLFSFFQKPPQQSGRELTYVKECRQNNPFADNKYVAICYFFALINQNSPCQ